MAERRLESRMIGVIGAGAIGGWVAAKLRLAGHHVAVAARGATRQEIERKGLILRENGRSQTVQVAVGDATTLGPQDVLIIAVKSPGLADAAEAARGMIGPDTRIVPML